VYGVPDHLSACWLPSYRDERAALRERKIEAEGA
jgi:hypothetical protein